MKLNIVGDNFVIKFNKTTGFITSIQYNDKEYLHINNKKDFGPKLQIYRAPLDNDGKVIYEWQKYNFENMKSTLQKLKVTHGKNKSIIIETDINYRANKKASLLHRSIYTILSNGIIVVDNQFIPKSDLPTLPGLAVLLTLNSEYENIKWYGRGPHENYSDRKTGAAIGLYQSTVTEQYFPYIKPQATGSKQDVRWLLLSDNKQQGIMFSNSSYPFAFSALHYSQEALSIAKHTNELKQSEEIYLNLYASERGVGNASCGPEILEQYKVNAEPKSFRYSIRPMNGNLENVNSLARQKLPVVSIPMISRDKYGKVKISSTSSKDNIYYTLDGSEPTKTSNKYFLPFEYTAASEIKAKVINNDSESITTSLKVDKLKMFSPVIFPQNIYFVDSLFVDLSSKIEGADIYYSLDGTNPNKKSNHYKSPISIKESCQLKVVAYKKGFALSDIVTSEYKKVKYNYGIQYKYYVDHWTKIPNFLYLKPDKTGIIDRFDLNAIETNKDHYALLLFTSINIKEKGEYIIYVGSNDGSKLTIDNKLVVNNDGEHGYQEMSGKINLSKGKHFLELSYFQSGGGQELKVFWKGPGFEKRIMKMEDFSDN